MPTLLRVLAVLDEFLKTLRPALRLHLPASFPVRPAYIPGNPPGGSVPVFAAVVEDADGSFAVPARPAGFLVEALKGLGHAPVNHEPDVFLVDAHAERGRCHDDVVARFVVDPFLLAIFPFGFGEAGVVGCGTDFLGSKAGGEGITIGAESRVDDAGDGVCTFGFGGEFFFAGWVRGTAVVDALKPGGEVGKANVVGVGRETDLVVQVRPGGGRGEDLEGGRVEGERGDDVVADTGSGGCGETDDGSLGVGSTEMGKVGVGGAEVVAPFGDTVGFVDGDTGELVLGVDGLQVAAEGFALAVFRGHVEKTGTWVAAAEVLDDGVTVLEGGVGVYGGDFDAGGTEGGDLVVHQGE